MNDEEPSKKVKKENTDFFYFYALTGSTNDDDIWLIDNGASRHMIGDRSNLPSIREKMISQKVELGDNHSYAVKGIGKTSIELEPDNNLHLNNVLYVLGLKKNLVSISCLEDKGDRIAFVDGKVLVWPKGSSIDNAELLKFVKEDCINF